MPNYTPIYLLIGLIPLAFLAIAWYSSRTFNNQIQSPPKGPTSQTSTTTKRRRECLHSCCAIRSRSDDTTDAPKTTTTDDLEMQRTQVPSPDPPLPHRAEHHTTTLERAAAAAATTTTQYHRAAALAALERSSSPVGSSVFELQPRPRALPAPSSAASVGKLYYSQQWWELAESGVGGSDVMPAFRRTIAVSGRKSLFGLREVEEQGAQGDDGWVEVSLQ